MPRRRLVAAVLVAAVSLGSTVLAACELACSLDRSADAAARMPSRACHETSPAPPSRCSERHALRLAVVDAGANPVLAAPPPAPLWITLAPSSVARVRSSLFSPALTSASPPLILRV